MIRILLLIACAASSVGCIATDFLGGLGESGYSCPSPKGGRCDSISRIHETGFVSGDVEQHLREEAKPRVPNDIPGGLQPLRSPPRVLRLWLAPFVDSDGDLHDQRYIYLVVDVGSWLIGDAPDRLRSVAGNSP